jgi:hypothetical protein
VKATEKLIDKEGWRGGQWKLPYALNPKINTSKKMRKIYTKRVNKFNNQGTINRENDAANCEQKTMGKHVKGRKTLPREGKFYEDWFAHWPLVLSSISTSYLCPTTAKNRKIVYSSSPHALSSCLSERICQ